MTTRRRVIPAGRCLDLGAASGYLGLAPRTVWRMVEKGTLRPIRFPKVRKVLFDRADLDALVEASKDEEAQ